MSAESSITWRTISPGESREITLLLNQAFSLVASNSYLDDFPVWNPANTLASDRFQLGGYYGAKLVSTASLRLATYRFSDGKEARLGLIGAVATHPEFMRKGYAAKAIDLLIHEGEKRNVDAFALWGIPSALYEKRSFKFGGRQLRIPIAALEIPKTLVQGFEFRLGWDEVIGEKFLSRRAGVRYTDRDLVWMSQHRNVEWRTLWVDGKCLAYCAWNRGIDLPGIIHELDGDPGAVMTLLRLVRDRYPNLEWLVHPDALERSSIRVNQKVNDEFLAQFSNRFLEESRIDQIWFSGMDSC